MKEDASIERLRDERFDVYGTVGACFKSPEQEWFLTDAGSGGPNYYPDLFREHHPEIAEKLDLRSGSGVYIMESDRRRVVIRYPDGREQEVIWRELLKPRGAVKWFMNSS